MLGVPLHCFHSSIGPEGSAFKDAANLRLIRHASLAQVGFKYRPAFLALDSLREPVRAGPASSFSPPPPPPPPPPRRGAPTIPPRFPSPFFLWGAGGARLGSFWPPSAKKRGRA